MGEGKERKNASWSFSVALVEKRNHLERR